MARSVKAPYLTNQNSSGKPKYGEDKRKANRAVRKMNKKACEEVDKEKLVGGKQYRKASNSYYIRDYSFHDPKNKKASRK